MLLVHRRDIVEPVEIGQRLQIGLVLDQLLGAAMEQPDMRIDALDHLAVELEHEAQHAVGRRVLRPEIDGEVAVLGFGVRRTRSVASVSSRNMAAAFATLAAMPRLNLSQLTMKRSWVACADLIHAVMGAKLEARARPASRSTHSASTVTVIPRGVADLCETSTCVPRHPLACVEMWLQRVAHRSTP